MGDRARDQAIVSKLHTIATRTWEEPTGQDRADRLAELATAASGRTDLMIEAAGIMLGLRPADQHDPHHGKYSAGAGLLLELACVPDDDPAVQEWIPVGAERRARWRCPANRGGIA